MSSALISICLATLWGIFILLAVGYFFGERIRAKRAAQGKKEINDIPIKLGESLNRKEQVKAKRDYLSRLVRCNPALTVRKGQEIIKLRFGTGIENSVAVRIVKEGKNRA